MTIGIISILILVLIAIILVTKLALFAMGLEKKNKVLCAERDSLKIENHELFCKLTTLQGEKIADAIKKMAGSEDSYHVGNHLSDLFRLADDETLHAEAMSEWQKDQQTNPSKVNHYAFAYGYKVAMKKYLNARA